MEKQLPPSDGFVADRLWQQATWHCHTSTPRIELSDSRVAELFCCAHVQTRNRLRFDIEPGTVLEDEDAHKLARLLLRVGRHESGDYILKIGSPYPAATRKAP